MLAYSTIYVLCFLGVGICLAKDAEWRSSLQRLYLPILAFFLIAVAGLRSAQIDRDYVNYLSWFETLTSGALTWTDFGKDPAFVIITYPFAKLHINYAGALTLFIAIALVAKLAFAKLASNSTWLTLFVYLMVCRFFLVQEMTAIRVAAAIPFLSLAILLVYRKKKKLGLLCYLAAVAFHLSALIALPLLVLTYCNVRFRSIWWILCLVPAGIAVAVSLRSVLELVANFDRLSPYFGENAEVQTFAISLLSVYFLVRITILILATWFWRELSDEERLIAFCSACGVFFQAVLYSNDVLALRVSELFGLFDILLFLIPLNHWRRIPALCYLCFLVAMGAEFFVSSASLIKPYDWIFG